VQIRLCPRYCRLFNKNESPLEIGVLTHFIGSLLSDVLAGPPHAGWNGCSCSHVAYDNDLLRSQVVAASVAVLRHLVQQRAVPEPLLGATLKFLVVSWLDDYGAVIKLYYISTLLSLHFF